VLAPLATSTLTSKHSAASPAIDPTTASLTLIVSLTLKPALPPLCTPFWMLVHAHRRPRGPLSRSRGRPSALKTLRRACARLRSERCATR